jgi:heparan-sulfate lyase
VDGAYFAIVDEAFGDAAGTVNLNWHFCEGPVKIDSNALTITSDLIGPSNVTLKCFSASPVTLRKQAEGWRSTEYRQRVERTSVSFDVEKTASDAAVRYITVIVPIKSAAMAPKIEARFINAAYNPQSVDVEVIVGGKKRLLSLKAMR